jgi:hypothetical protein
MLLQIHFLTQYLAVEQPGYYQGVDQQDPVREDQELPQQDDGKSGVDRVAAEGKDTADDQ